MSINNFHVCSYIVTYCNVYFSEALFLNTFKANMLYLNTLQISSIFRKGTIDHDNVV